ncbi:MAG: hypothetical protein RI906_3071 [Pseudomonadota bacterium]|jgi:N-methylhydantoinase A
MPYRIGIDIGGTFTDFALFDDIRREVVTHKALTTPARPEEAVLEGIQALCDLAGVPLSKVSMVVHGTTLVTNAAIERRGAPTAMLVTRGFRDIPDIALEQRYDLYDMRIRFPQPLVPRYLRIEVEERVGWDGSVRVPLNLSGIQESVRHAVNKHGVQSVAICLLHSYVNDSHERELADWIKREFPDLFVSASANVFPFAREYQRWTSTCLNAYVQPLVDDYVRRLEGGLASAGFTGQFLIMSSSGSTLTPSMARQFPVRLLESGPAAGALMSARHSMWLNKSQILSFDMGGTTAKGCVVRGQAPLKRYEFEVARVHEFKRGSGLPVKIPVIDMIEIGAGGGSLADIDARGVLRVGPRSAGAVPGPACYARGGTEPTLTDANLLLGYLDANSFLGGRMKLDPEAAARAVAARIGSSLSAEPIRAAWGIHEVINEDVAKAFRVHASERGVDYRRCSMIVFGGSGPVHGCRIARKLRVPQVICPAGAGVMSAFGLLSSPLGFELVQSLRVALADLDVNRFTHLVSDLQSRIREQLTQTGARLDEARFELRLDMRYVGQGYEVEVFVQEDDLQAAYSGLSAGFERAYSAVFGQSFDNKEIEIVAWKVEMHGPVPGAAQAYDLRDDGRRDAVALRGERPAYFGDDGGFLKTRVYDRFGLRPNDVIEGPALIEEPESTCVLAPGDRAHVDSRYNLVIDIGSAS